MDTAIGSCVTWGNVERKVKPAENLLATCAKPLDQTKSSLSLAEICGQEFLNQSQVVTSSVNMLRVQDKDKEM